MDFRMDKSSWALLAFMLLTFGFFIVKGGGGTEISAVGYLQVILYAIVTTIALVALASIPVLIYCYIVKKIPDIDYSIRAAAIITLVGIISEFIF